MVSNWCHSAGHASRAILFSHPLGKSDASFGIFLLGPASIAVLAYTASYCLQLACYTKTNASFAISAALIAFSASPWAALVVPTFAAVGIALALAPVVLLKNTIGSGGSVAWLLWISAGIPLLVAAAYSVLISAITRGMGAFGAIPARSLFRTTFVGALLVATQMVAANFLLFFVPANIRTSLAYALFVFAFLPHQVLLWGLVAKSGKDEWRQSVPSPTG